MGAALSSTALTRVVRRNTLLLGACLAVTWSIVQLHTATGAVTLAVVVGNSSLGGLSPAVYLACWAAASFPMGRYMDVHGRVPGLRLGFIAAMVGSLFAGAGTMARQPALFLLGVALVGAGTGALNLARAGAVDMYPSERRARGVSLVLVGAALGAILGPIVFTPSLSGVHDDLVALARPWLAAALLLAGGAALTYAIRIDPMRIAAIEGINVGQRATPVSTGRSVGEILRAGSVRSAVAAAVTAQAVMASAMGVVGLILVTHGHDLGAVSLTISAHFLGMFGLVLVVGQLVDRIGRVRSAVVGLLVLGAGVLGLTADSHLETVAPAMFAIGLGWNLAFVAATALIADSTEPHERARVLGLSDLLGIGLGALGSALGAAVLGATGVLPLAVAGAVFAVLPAILIARHPARATESV